MRKPILGADLANNLKKELIKNKIIKKPAEEKNWYKIEDYFAKLLDEKDYATRNAIIDLIAEETAEITNGKYIEIRKKVAGKVLFKQSEVGE